MIKERKDPKAGEAGKGSRIKFGRRPAWLMVLLLLALVVVAAYQITVGLGVHDRESFLRELLGVLGMVFLFLLGGAALGLLLVTIKSAYRRRRAPNPWEIDKADKADETGETDETDETDERE